MYVRCDVARLLVSKTGECRGLLLTGLEIAAPDSVGCIRHVYVEESVRCVTIPALNALTDSVRSGLAAVPHTKTELVVTVI